MTAVMLRSDEKRRWVSAAAIAMAAHGLLGLAAMAWRSPADPVIPEPVVLVELPPASASEAMPEPQPASQPEYSPPEQALPFRVAAVRAPVPDDAVILPPEPKQTPSPAMPIPRPAPAPVAAPVPTRTEAAPTAAAGPAASNSAGESPRAKKEKANYYAMVSAHLRARPASRESSRSGSPSTAAAISPTSPLSGPAATPSSIRPRWR